MTELAIEAGVGGSYFTRILRLSFLAPEVVKTILRDRLIGPEIRKIPCLTGNSPGQRTTGDPALTRARLLPGLAPGSRCSTGMGPNTAHVRRLAHNGLFGDKCRGWLAE